MKMNNKLMSILKNSLLYLLGIIFILVIVYLRVLKVRLPVQIDFSFNWIIFGIGCSTIIFCLINLYRQFPKGSNELIISKTIRSIISKIQSYIYKPLFMIFEVIEKREIIRNLLYQISIRTIQLEFYTHYIYFFIMFMPKLVVGLTFVLDVCIYNYMYYFYKSLLLLLLPLILRVLLYMLSTWAAHCKKELEQYIDVKTEKALHVTNGYDCTVTYKWRSINKADENIQAYIDYYEMCVRILIIYDAIKIEESKLIFRCGFICINMLFIIGWCYIIYFMCY
jgi:hypothetical protein